MRAKVPEGDRHCGTAAMLAAMGRSYSFLSS
jgi:hypothetical protein